MADRTRERLPVPVPAVPHRWPARRWLVAAAATAVFALAVGIPTDLVDTPLFSREIPPTRWALPALLASAVLSGLLAATYVARPQAAAPTGETAPRGGYLAGVLTFFAVGCPVCNKIVLVALGSAGAVTWFAPVQPFLQVAAIGLVAWALRRGVRTESACTLPAP